MNHDGQALPAYGLWLLVLINSAVFILFAFSFFKPRTKRDWRTFGSFSAFLVALFAEMYGFPLTIYLFSGWLARRFPGVDFLSHDAGHIWYRLFGFEGNPHLNPIHVLSNVLIVAGFFLLAGAWRVLFAAQKEGALATAGPYARIRHPQYAAFIVIMIGFLLQWPTLITLVMFPILVTVYVRLAHREEREVAAELGEAWARYASATPRWFPRLLGRARRGAGHAGGSAWMCATLALGLIFAGGCRGREGPAPGTAGEAAPHEGMPGMEGKGTARADAAARAPTEVTIDPARQQLGGMVTTTFLGLLVLPALYFIWRGRRYPRAHRRDEAALEPGGGPVE